MAIGFTPFTPTSTDRGHDPRSRNPKQPELDKRKAEQVETEEPADGEAPDALERAVPPVAPTH